MHAIIHEKGHCFMLATLGLKICLEFELEVQLERIREAGCSLCLEDENDRCHFLSLIPPPFWRGDAFPASGLIRLGAYCMYRELNHTKDCLGEAKEESAITCVE